MISMYKAIDILSGFAFDSKLFNSSGKGLPLVRIRDVGRNSSGTFYSGAYKDDYLIENGDFLIGMDGEFRLAEWSGGKALLNQRVCKIMPKHESLYPKYLFYLMPKELKRIEDTTSFVTVKHLSVKKIKEIKIPLPSLEEQKKIAAILDAADALRQKDAQLIAKYNALSQSLFLDMFGDIKEGKYETKTLEDLFGKGEYGAGAKAVGYSENSPRYIRITDIDAEGALRSKKVSSDLPEKDLAKYTLKKGDLLFARSGATVGKTYLYRKSHGDLVYAGYLIKFSIKEPFNAEYFFHFTKTAFYNAWIQKIQNVVAQPNINAKQYGQELNVPIPPVELQNQFAERIQHIETQKQQAQAALQKSEDLFNSLLQRAFKGELTQEREVSHA